MLLPRSFQFCTLVRGNLKFPLACCGSSFLFHFFGYYYVGRGLYILSAVITPHPSTILIYVRIAPLASILEDIIHHILLNGLLFIIVMEAFILLFLMLEWRAEMIHMRSPFPFPCDISRKKKGRHKRMLAVHYQSS